MFTPPSSGVLSGSHLASWLLLFARIRGGSCYTPLNSNNFRTATLNWCGDSPQMPRAQVEQTHGLLKYWDVSAVTNMQAAFQDCGDLTNELEGNSWNTAAVTNMAGALLAAPAANACAAVPCASRRILSRRRERVRWSCMWIDRGEACASLTAARAPSLCRSYVLWCQLLRRRSLRLGCWRGRHT